ncbi:hypothetical protein MSPP1_003939 [Malassezia sp. CBS 17886]|nr:hypothetical protein MSPP1_003939 [Malassezia sp. CBS 17886]
MVPSTDTDNKVPHEYEEPASGVASPLVGEPPVRHLFIDWPSSSIKGTFAIGAGAPDASPPLYDLPQSDVVARNAASAVFYSRTSPVHVVVQIQHAKATPTPPPEGPPAPAASPAASPTSLRQNTVYVSARSVRNSVHVQVPQYVGRLPLHIRCQSTTGNVTVVLPFTFNGMLSWKVDTGTMSMSPGVEERAQRLDARHVKRHGTAKIGAPPELPPWMTANGKRGDLCEISTNTGRLSVCFCGEKAAQGCVVG